MIELRYDVRRGADTYRMISHDRLKTWILKGIINHDESLVWRSGLSGWRKPEEIEELMTYFEEREEERLRRIAAAAKPALFPQKLVKNILIVDDEEDLCWLLSNTLQREGYNVSTANTVSDGMARLKEAPDLLFLDLKLPNGDGMELLSSIREITPQTIVCIVSAYGSEEKRGQAKEEGVYCFLDKPFTEETILETLGKFKKKDG